MILPNKKLWLPGRDNKQPCLKNGYAQSLKDAREHRNRFRFNPLAKVADMFVPKPLRMSPGYPCCCGGGGICSICPDSLSEQYAITISLVSVLDEFPDITCDYCDDFNGEYIVSYVGIVDEACRWSYELPDSICGLEQLILTVYSSGVKIEFAGSGGRSLFWQCSNNPAMPSIYDEDCICSEFKSITYIARGMAYFAGEYCDYALATAVITEI